MGPYANPQEAYEYYTLPYCAPENDVPHLFNKAKTGQYLGELLGGHSLRSSGHDLAFAPSEGTVKEECTTKPLTEKQAESFAKAVSEHWFYQLYLDELPVWGMVGEMLSESEPSVDKVAGHRATDQILSKVVGGKGGIAAMEQAGLSPYVYTERKLTISYNKDRIVKLDLLSEPHSLVRVKPGTSLRFSFTFVWEETTDIPYEGRFDRYLDHAFFKHQIHWFSIFNSFMMVLFLTGLVALILLRTLKADYARYSSAATSMTAVPKEKNEDALEKGEGDETALLTSHVPTEDSGWKQVHGDVFRAPAHLPLLSALLGTGSQLFVLTFGVIVFANAGPIHGGDVYEERGTILHAAIVLYALSASVAGYISGKYYQIYSFRKTPKSAAASKSIGWQTTMGLTVILFPTGCMVIMSVLNMISFYYGTIHTISFLTILKLFAMWIFVSVPLCILGTLAGRHKLFVLGPGKSQQVHPFPCRVNAIPRPIPAASDVPWYGRPLVLIPLSGLLPFGSIFIELYYVLTSLWNYKFYHVYGFMLGVYTILIIVTAMTSIISVYFLLNSGENYQWHWVSFFSGASTSLYVFLYGVYYFYFKTSMYGILQTSFYFGYTALIAASLGTLCGTLGHLSADRFVRRIFQNVKVD